MTDDAETQKMLHSPWSTMPKHKGSHYIVSGQQQLTQIDYNSSTVSQAPTIAVAWEVLKQSERKSRG
jgi:hypothetical protein